MSVVNKMSFFETKKRKYSQLEALQRTWQWDEARRRCEVWAYKLDVCECITGITSLPGYAEGGAPPRVCLQAMAASLREGYCKVLRYVQPSNIKKCRIQRLARYLPVLPSCFDRIPYVKGWGTFSPECSPSGRLIKPR